MIRASVFVFLLGITVVSCIQTYYMDYRCGTNLTFHSTGIYQIRLKATQRSTYAKNMNCLLYTRTTPGNRLMLYFKSVETTSCSHAYLNLYDGNNTSIPLPGASRKCGYNPGTSKIFTTSSNALTLNFISDGYSFRDTGFDMIITSYHTGSCYGYEYSCDNGRCVYDGLECNGHNPCGDFSDCPLAAGAIAGIVIGGFFFVVIATTAFIILRRRRRRYGRPLVTETTSYGTPGYGYNQPPPPAYPTGQQYPPPGPTAPYPQNQPPMKYPAN